MANDAGKTIEERFGDLGLTVVPLDGGRYKVLGQKGDRFFASAKDLKSFLGGLLDA